MAFAIHMRMTLRRILWSPEKDQMLRLADGRFGIGLAECAVAIEEGRILDNLESATRPNQRVFILEIDDYAFVVPYIFDDDTVFLKTIFPSRKYTARYLRTKQ
jgi:hypothetical protein